MMLCGDEILEMLKKQDSLPCSSHNSKQNFQFQEPIAVVWDVAAEIRQWCIGFVMEQDQTSLVVDHFERCSKAKDGEWQRPQNDDVQKVSMTQIIPLPVEGEWDFSGRIPKYILQNHPCL